MTLLKPVIASVVLAASLCFQLVFAQAAITVGDLMGKGGKVLNNEEVVKLVSGAKISGTQISTPTVYENTYSSDGVIKGRARRDDSPWHDLSGYWSVSNNGRFVQRIQNSSGSFTAYTIFVKVESAYYMAINDAPGSIAVLLDISR